MTVGFTVIQIMLTFRTCQANPTVKNVLVATFLTAQGPSVTLVPLENTP